MKAVFLLAVVVILCQTQLVSAGPIALIPLLADLAALGNVLAALLIALLQLVLNIVCIVLGPLITTITNLIPIPSVQLVGSLLCNSTITLNFTALILLVTNTLAQLLTLLGIPQLLAALQLPVPLNVLGLLGL